MAMSWHRLLSDLQCPFHEGTAPERSRVAAFRSAFEGDYDRIVFSPPFRRLARKTQVHPMALNDHVHTRLTHSLEVASVGRSLGHRLAAFLRQHDQLPPNVAEQDLIWIIQAACLAHDIGNPPFGHAGEYAIQHWTNAHQDEVLGPHPTPEAQRLLQDLTLFDGNAQGFPLAARADNPQLGYLRLTFATLATMIKYPWDSADPRAHDRHKFNVFSTEKWIFDLLTQHLGMHAADGTVCRHPLSFLAEAADDICYRILDIEDAVEMDILKADEARQVYRSFIAAQPKPAQTVGRLRGQAIEALINGTWKVFQDDYQNIMLGQRTADLKTDLDPALKDSLQQINRLYDRIFADRTKVAAELGAYQTLGRIVQSMCHATRQLAQTGCYNQTDFLVKRCLDLAWGKDYATDHQTRPYLWWLHQVIDFVSGLTDNYARQLSREIAGV